MKKQNHAATVTETQTGVENLEFVLSDASGLVEAAMNRALDLGARKMRLDGRQAVIERLQQGDRAAHSYVYYALAEQAAEWLGTWDEDVKAVYIYDCDATPEDLCFGQATRSLLLNLIVWARRKTGALTSILAALDRALTHSYASLTGQPERAHLLAVSVVDDDDVKHSIGCGALLSSLHTRPIRIWER